ncbi:hypothetical protein GQ44DRAFT_118597 [Phaeosphaeriaceae sp. PMI808]|nr:hypothetical protein GQ44DRAFT_118597 [Phaeosphaeriaceae sp. PMI808]
MPQSADFEAYMTSPSQFRATHALVSDCREGDCNELLSALSNIVSIISRKQPATVTFLTQLLRSADENTVFKAVQWLAAGKLSNNGIPNPSPQKARKEPQSAKPLGEDLDKEYFSSFKCDKRGLSDTAVERLVNVAQKVRSLPADDLKKFRSSYDPEAKGSIQNFWNFVQPKGKDARDLIRWTVTTLESGKFSYSVRDKILKCILSELIDGEEDLQRTQSNPDGKKYRVLAREATVPKSEDTAKWGRIVKRHDLAGQRWRKFEPGCLIGFGGVKF